jgi:hypothetical protein
MTAAMTAATHQEDIEKDRQRAIALMAKIDDAGAFTDEQRTAAVQAVKLIKKHGFLERLDALAQVTKARKVARRKTANAPVSPEETLQVTEADDEHIDRYCKAINTALNNRIHNTVEVDIRERIRLAVVHWIYKHYDGWQIAHRYDWMSDAAKNGNVYGTIFTFTTKR